MSKRGVLVVISGFSGVGKGTVVKKMMEDYEQYALSISATTRNPREGEQEGVHYFFKTKEEFEQMIKEDALIEYACYVNNYYGTPKAYVEEQLEKGKDVILEIELQGALEVKKKFPDTLLLFIAPPNAAVLKERLTSRGTETADVIEARLSRACEESEWMEAYDYIIVNDVLEDCVKETHEIIQGEHAKAFRNKEEIKVLKADLKQFMKVKGE